MVPYIFRIVISLILALVASDVHAAQLNYGSIVTISSESSRSKIWLHAGSRKWAVDGDTADNNPMNDVELLVGPSWESRSEGGGSLFVLLDPNDETNRGPINYSSFVKIVGFDPQPGLPSLAGYASEGWVLWLNKNSRHTPTGYCEIIASKSNSGLNQIKNGSQIFQLLSADNLTGSILSGASLRIKAKAAPSEGMLWSFEGSRYGSDYHEILINDPSGQNRPNTIRGRFVIARAIRDIRNAGTYDNLIAKYPQPVLTNVEMPADHISNSLMFDLPNSVVNQGQNVAAWHMKFPAGVLSGSFEFDAQGGRDLNFFIGTEGSRPVCDVVLWGWGNAASAIRRASPTGVMNNPVSISGSRSDVASPVSIKVTLNKAEKRITVQTKKKTDAAYPASASETNPSASRLFMSYVDQSYDQLLFNAISFSSWDVPVRWKFGPITTVNTPATVDLASLKAAREPLANDQYFKAFMSFDGAFKFVGQAGSQPTQEFMLALPEQYRNIATVQSDFNNDADITKIQNVVRAFTAARDQAIAAQAAANTLNESLAAVAREITLAESNLTSLPVIPAELETQVSQARAQAAAWTADSAVVSADRELETKYAALKRADGLLNEARQVQSTATTDTKSKVLAKDLAGAQVALTRLKTAAQTTTQHATELTTLLGQMQTAISAVSSAVSAATDAQRQSTSRSLSDAAAQIASVTQAFSNSKMIYKQAADAALASAQSVLADTDVHIKSVADQRAQCEQSVTRLESLLALFAEKKSASESMMDPAQAAALAAEAVRVSTDAVDAHKVFNDRHALLDQAVSALQAAVKAAQDARAAADRLAADLASAQAVVTQAQAFISRSALEPAPAQLITDARAQAKQYVDAGATPVIDALAALAQREKDYTDALAVYTAALNALKEKTSSVAALITNKNAQEALAQSAELTRMQADTDAKLAQVKEKLGLIAPAITLLNQSFAAATMMLEAKRAADEAVAFAPGKVVAALLTQPGRGEIICSQLTADAQLEFHASKDLTPDVKEADAVVIVRGLELNKELQFRIDATRLMPVLLAGKVPMGLTIQQPEKIAGVSSVVVRSITAGRLPLLRVANLAPVALRPAPFNPQFAFAQAGAGAINLRIIKTTDQTNPFIILADADKKPLWSIELASMLPGSTITITLLPDQQLKDALVVKTLSRDGVETQVPYKATSLVSTVNSYAAVKHVITDLSYECELVATAAPEMPGTTSGPVAPSTVQAPAETSVSAPVMPAPPVPVDQVVQAPQTPVGVLPSTPIPNLATSVPTPPAPSSDVRGDEVVTAPAPRDPVVIPSRAPSAPQVQETQVANITSTESAPAAPTVTAPQVTEVTSAAMTAPITSSAAPVSDAQALKQIVVQEGQVSMAATGGTIPTSNQLQQLQAQLAKAQADKKALDAALKKAGKDRQKITALNAQIAQANKLIATLTNQIKALIGAQSKATKPAAKQATKPTTKQAAKPAPVKANQQKKK